MYDYLLSPLGELLLVVDDAHRLIRVGLPAHTATTTAIVAGEPMKPPVDASYQPGALGEVVAQLEAYFAGGLTNFDVEIETGGTAFQRDVWAALTEIPYGSTASYGEIAARVGRPGAARAVGMANRANPVPIVIPCHRVVGANGTLTGYAGPDGLEMKRVLLGLESRVRQFN